MKRGRQQGSSNRLLLLFLFIFAILIVEFGLNNTSLLVIENKITGLQTADLGNTIRNALGLFSDILTPLFEVIGEDRNAIFLRVIYWLFLFFIISGFDGLRKRFGADETGVKRANIIAGLLALIAVIFTPVEFLLLIGNSAFLFVVIGLILGGLYWVYNFQRGEENRFTYFIKAFASFVLLILINTSSSYVLTKFDSALGAGAIFNTVLSLGMLVSFIFFFWYLFIKTLTGGTAVEEPVGGSTPTGSLSRAGRAYGELGTSVGGGVKRGWGAFRNWRQRKKQAGGQQKAPSMQQPQQQVNVQQIKQNLLRNYYMPIQAAHQQTLNELNSNNPNLNNIKKILSALRNNSRGIIATLGGSSLTSPAVNQVMGLARSINTRSDRLLGIRDARQLSIEYRRGRNMQNWIVNLGRAINNL
ncbi:MAG: hypothetical protein AABX55_02220 [Nanoarchaeota archaeon]